MVGLRLFLPENWTSDAARLDGAGMPEDLRAYCAKPEIALAEIDRIRAAGVRFGCVLANAGCGLSASFRQGLSERGLAWAAGMPFKQKVYPADISMVSWCRLRTPEKRRDTRRHLGIGTGHAGGSKMAPSQLAARNQRKALGVLRCGSRKGRRRTAAAYPRYGSSAPAR